MYEIARWFTRLSIKKECKIKKVLFIATAVAIIIVLLFYLCFSTTKEVTAEAAHSIPEQYSEPLDEIVQYLSSEPPQEIFNNLDYHEYYYLKEDLLPTEIQEAMTVYFQKIVKRGHCGIHILSADTEYLLTVNHLPDATGVSFSVYSGDRGKDAEGVDIQVYQYLIYISSPNPSRFINQIWGLESSEHLEENWYLVTQIIQ